MGFKKPEIRRTDKTLSAYKNLPLQDFARRDLRKEEGMGSCWTLPEYYNQVYVKEHVPLTTLETVAKISSPQHFSQQYDLESPEHFSQRYD